MEKEINEIPEVISRVKQEYKTKDMSEVRAIIQAAPFVHIAACGTAYHVGLMMSRYLEEIGKRSKVYIASEVATSPPLITQDDISVVITQSGETGDTLNALEHFKKQGLKTIAICNVDESTIARSVDFNLSTFAGPEISIASTKAYCAQVLVAEILVKGMPDADCRAIEVISKSPEIKKKAKRFKNIKRILFLGKGEDYVTSLESALKVKEITYLHCEGFATGELWHGPLSLLDSKTLCIVYGDCKKSIDTVAEVIVRNANIWHVSGDYHPIEKIIHAQLFALYLSQEKGLDTDKPRNLVKSVVG